MTVSFENIPKTIDYHTQKLKEKCPNDTGVIIFADNNHEVTVRMRRVLANQGMPKNVQHSAYKACLDTATVTIVPHNEELAGIIGKYYLDQKIPAGMGAPERYQFDVVLINENSIIG